MRYRPTWAEVDLGAVRNNTRVLVAAAKAKGLRLIGVVKANAYGHGAVACSRAVLEGGASGLAVALPEEGAELRQAGIDGQILVMGAYVPGTAGAYAEHRLDVTVSSFEQGEALGREVASLAGGAGTFRPLRVHVKVDTGMGRLGVAPEEALGLARLVASHPSLELYGVFTHLATADEEDRSFALEQLARFEAVLASFRASGFQAVQAHALNSGGLMQHAPGTTDACRVGIALYGLSPSPFLKGALPLTPALSLKTRVVAVKRAPRGTTVSYGRRYRTERETTLAALPVGYADGLTRLLSHRASVLIRGKRYPIVGAICMDQAIVDVGDDAVAPGDEVTLIGRQGGEAITADDWADALGTINYEVVCMISDRVPRVYLDGVTAPSGSGGSGGTG